ncbi:MAG: response regulator transcription factor [Nannocystaceae bacterium]
MTRPRIVLADDHVVMLEGLRALLQPRYDVVACVHDGHALIEAVLEHAPDVVVSDISMPGDGFEAARRIRELAPKTQVVLLTMNDSPALAAGALRLGVSAYVLKTEAADELEAAIDAALAGQTHLSPGLVDETLSELSGRPEPNRRGMVAELTDRQLEVLRLLGRGYTMKEAAEHLHISPRTVAFHKYRIMEVMEVKTSAELIRKAIEGGLVES